MIAAKFLFIPSIHHYSGFQSLCSNLKTGETESLWNICQTEKIFCSFIGFLRGKSRQVRSSWSAILRLLVILAIRLKPNVFLIEWNYSDKHQSDIISTICLRLVLNIWHACLFICIIKLEEICSKASYNVLMSSFV